MCSYYRKFIPNMAEIAKALVRLTKKNVEFDWADECQAAFDLLKHMLAVAPILAFPNPKHRFALYTDASAHTIGSVLAQIDDQGTERVVQYASQKLTETEERWSASEKECYAIVRAVQKFRQYLLGTEFTLFTDHKPLSTLFVATVKNTRIQRWATILSEYDMKIEHKPGGQMRADFLSRIPTPATETKPSDGDEGYLPEIYALQPPPFLLCDRCSDPLLAIPSNIDENPWTNFEYMAKNQRDRPLQLCEACEEDLHDLPYLGDEEEEDPTEGTPTTPDGLWRTTQRQNVPQDPSTTLLGIWCTTTWRP